MAQQPDKEALDRLIAAEKEELKNAPKIPITYGIERCHICGGVFQRDQLKSYDTHISGRLVRRACPFCQRG